jgi:carbon monoxide dehydrogenase subunit G
MKKLLKIFLVLAVLFVGAGLAVGFLADPAFESKVPFVVSAPVEQVFALVSDPSRVKEWLPKDAADIESTEMLGKGLLDKAAGAALDAALGGGTNAGKMTPTHVYHLAGGAKMEMQTTAREKNAKYLERVVGGDSGLEKMVSSIEWGFEMAPVEGDRSKTALTVVSRGVARKPVGNLAFAVGRLIGMEQRNAREIAANVEKALAKK